MSQTTEMRGPQTSKMDYTKPENLKTIEEAQEADKKTCLQLQHIFHMAMLMGTLPYLKTKEKMMNYLNRSGDPDWTASYIWGFS